MIMNKDHNSKIYIEMSKNNINGYINKNDYRKAFGLLILVLERLDGDEKNEFIDYYSKHMFNMKSHFKAAAAAAAAGADDVNKKII